MFLTNYKKFIDEIYKRLSNLGIETSTLKIDHLGFQVDSKKDYDDKVSQVKESTTMISENIVGGRRVGIFKLATPLSNNDQEILMFEIFEPKEGEKVNSAWEHVELLTENALEEFMDQYKDLEWDTSMLNRDEFPMLKLSLGDGLRAKFPRRGVLEEVERQKRG